MPIDHEHNRHKSFTKIFNVDLANDKAWVFLDMLRETTTIVAWHFGLPCGTCSRAREIPLADGSWGPMPLRNEQYLLGVPWMSARDETKVQAANQLYERACAFVLHLLFLKHVVTIENPTDSWLWHLPFLLDIYKYCFFVHLHACMFGGTRKKRTSFLTNETRFQALQRFCDGSHQHAEWGVDDHGNFATSFEAQYPADLCHEYCNVLTQILPPKPLNMQDSSGDPVDTPVEGNDAKVHAYAQPRGRKVRQLVPEFLKVQSIVLKEIPPVDRKKHTVDSVLDIPKGAKLLRTEAKVGGFLCVFGIFHSQQQFVQVSRTLLHPFDTFSHLPDRLLQCMFKLLTIGPVGVAKIRLEKLQAWRNLRERLSSDERNLHENIPKHMKRLVSEKQFLMLEQLAKDIGWPDESLHDEMRQGFKLVGRGTVSGVFQPEVKNANMTEDELMAQSKYIRPLILGKVKNAGRAEYAEELNSITRNEADNKGWLNGPMNEEAVKREIGRHWIPVERFAVRQKNKLRPIDNFASNKVNDAWTCPEKIDLHAMDQMTWLMAMFYRFTTETGCIDVVLSDGERLTGKVHEEWKNRDNRSLLTTLDLKDAYKQLGLHESDRNKAVIALKSDNHEGLDFYTMNCLPFGAASSVHSFNRVSRLLWAVGTSELLLPWTCYFDDFPLWTAGCLAKSTLGAAKGMLHLLGFRYAEHKLEEPKDSAEVLGICMDCSGVRERGELKYVMKESRRLEIMECLDKILREKAIIPFKLPSVLGRVQFADGQLTGRSGKLAMADMREVGVTCKDPIVLEDDTVRAVQCLRNRFADNNPKVLSLRRDENPVLLFTDGSFEPSKDGEVAMIGGVLITESTGCRVFGSHVPRQLLQRWHAAGKEHLIGQVELYAVLVARSLWKELLSGRRVILFIDNWAVLDCYIPGTSKEKTWRELLLKIEEIDFTHPCYAWATRVPSESNIADPPSRGTLEPLEFLGKITVEKPECPMLGVQMESCVS